MPSALNLSNLLSAAFSQMGVGEFFCFILRFQFVVCVLETQCSFSGIMQNMDLCIAAFLYKFARVFQHFFLYWCLCSWNNFGYICSEFKVMLELQIFRQACSYFCVCVFTALLLEPMCPIPCKPHSGCSEILPVVIANLNVCSYFSFYRNI